MPSLAQTMAVTPRVFAVEKQNAKIIPTQIIVDNWDGAAERVITIQDRFTTAASIIAATGAAVAAALTIVPRLIITVDNGGWATIAAEALKKLEILGQLEVAIDVADPINITNVTISWGFD